MFKTRVASRPLRPECQESLSPVAPVELRGLNEASRKRLAQQLDSTWCLNPQDASLKACRLLRVVLRFEITSADVYSQHVCCKFHRCRCCTAARRGEVGV